MEHPEVESLTAAPTFGIPVGKQSDPNTNSYSSSDAMHRQGPDSEPVI